MKIFQIVNGFCHWQTPFQSLEETSGFPADCIFVEAPDYVNEQWGFDDSLEGDERFIQPTPPEGWLYDPDTGTFYPEDELPRLLENAQESKQAENKMRLAEFLNAHPLTYTDGKQYGVTMEDQSEIQLNLSQYAIQVEAAKTDPTVVPILEWHAIHEACVPWTYEELSALVMAIANFVYPWFQLMNKYKEAIYSCTERSEVEAINLEYKTDEEKAAEEAAAAEEVVEGEVPVEEGTETGTDPSVETAETPVEETTTEA